MDNFELYNPTKLIFGENRISDLSKYLDRNHKLMLTFGMGSVKQNGIYNKITSILNDYNYIEFWGIEPNPKYETLLKAIEIARENEVDFLLAIGGGSVIDGTKFISASINFKGDTWNILSKSAKINTVIPFGTVLTLPATGSEMNSAAVISRIETKEKMVFLSEKCFPKFSILDISVINSLPKNQIANGIIDSFIHTTEQYMTYNTDAKIQDSFAEGILKTLICDGQKVYKDNNNKDACKNYMFSATMALNGLISSGVPTDWSIHTIGHELTALHNIDHAVTLAIILPSLYKIMLNEKLGKLVQYAENVWGIKNGTDKEKALLAIDKTEEFFQSLGVSTKLDDYIDDKNKTINEIINRFKNRKWTNIGENGIINISKIKEILLNC